MMINDEQMMTTILGNTYYNKTFVFENVYSSLIHECIFFLLLFGHKIN